ncbi:glucans biosynthesis glucosyltransferase H [Terrihabitans soli]|uniref:Glucans biosynthesis glucosyltransferase H n=1 Tax=Terrihabitans soli TaxID=708113 RepID=A0A6S6QRJ3_9HYPH|nr:glucans biosynthesis glucosyltransferase MdoH [Terrihabitans soli]BCJ89892.1 glucans biosynthesis glucosyltransferase H [Terrihabitans soli]
MDAVATERPPAAIGPDFRALPPETPLAMPVQDLHTAPAKHGRPASQPRLVFLRRAFVLLTTIILTAFAANEMFLVMNVAGLTFLEGLVLVLFVALFAWIAFSAASAVGGFFSYLFDRGWKLGIHPRDPLPPLARKTALLLPAYNEDPSRTTAGLQTIYEDLAHAGALAHFDFYILSDTTNPNIWIAEEEAFLSLRDRTGGHDRIFYRRRAKNVERKAGNISDWVRRFGGAYDTMVILDADSIMSADALIRMSAAMEQHPDVGLIQTLPVIVNGTTLFARLQQFAGRVYGPLIAHGIAWWHGSEGNYWGHNAAIRTKAFAEQAGLPELKGRKPFGGHILSHDFVEAALMRRAGWAVHMVPGLQGSYEESPPSLTEVAARDRRWCQGNLQHAAVLPARGLHWVSRLHMLQGIGSYITAPLWLGFLAIGMAIALQARFITPDYFGDGLSLFPNWPAQDPVRAAWVFTGTMGILLLPKFLSYIALLTRPEDLRGTGGAFRAFISLIAETLIAGLIAPVMMLIQSLAVFDILIGRDSGWAAQRRDDGSIPLSDVIRRYIPHTLFGIGTGIAAYAVSVSLFLWMTPVVLGMVLAIPLAAWTGARSAGQSFRRSKLLLTPEETAPPPVLARANTIVREIAFDSNLDAARRLASDPRLLAAHRAMLPPQRQRKSDTDLALGLAKLEESEGGLDAALAELSVKELSAVLSDTRGVDRLVALATP